MQNPISKFPETFGLDLSAQSKGDFPFKSMPSIDYYDPDTKRDGKKQDEFIAWHKKIVEQIGKYTSKFVLDG